MKYTHRDIILTFNKIFINFSGNRVPRKSDLVMPEQARAIANELGIYYYEASVFTYYGVAEVFENAIRAALIARRQQRFWIQNLKKVQRPLMQTPFVPPKPIPLEVVLTQSTYEDNMKSLWTRPVHIDVALIVGGTCTFSAHRCLLSAASPAFHRLFSMELTHESTPRSSSESSMASTFGEATVGDFNDDTECLIRNDQSKPAKSVFNYFFFFPILLSILNIIIRKILIKKIPESGSN